MHREETESSTAISPSQVVCRSPLTQAKGALLPSSSAASAPPALVPPGSWTSPARPARAPSALASRMHEPAENPPRAPQPWSSRAGGLPHPHVAYPPHRGRHRG
eukprot:scaffold198746_cov35-Tisochrysis_lutea.AAC.3